MDNIIQFGTLNENGTVTDTATLKQSNIKSCPFFIFLPDHYREDGSCKCSNAEHRAMMMKPQSKGGWGYGRRDFNNIPLID